MRTTETNKRLLAILEGTPDFVGFADPRGRILYINPSGMRLLGFSREDELTGKHMSVSHPDWANKNLVHTALPVAARNGVWKGELAFLHRDGHEVPVSTVILAHKSAAGEVEFFSTISRDITKQKQHEMELTAAQELTAHALSELQEAQQEIIQRERLKVREAMTRDIAHEFNNALTPILGYSEILINDPDLLDDRAETLSMLKNIHTSALEAKNAVQHLTRTDYLEDLAPVARSLTEP